MQMAILLIFKARAELQASLLSFVVCLLNFIFCVDQDFNKICKMYCRSEVQIVRFDVLRAVSTKMMVSSVIKTRIFIVTAERA
jgi:hypothetical protein